MGGTGVVISSDWGVKIEPAFESVAGHFNPGLFNQGAPAQVHDGYEEFRVEKSGVEMSGIENLQDISTPYFSTPSFKPSNFNPNRGAIVCKTNKTAVLPGFWEIYWAGQCYGGLA